MAKMASIRRARGHSHNLDLFDEPRIVPPLRRERFKDRNRRGEHDALIPGQIRVHGRITRGEGATMCKLTPEEASALLRALVDEGQIEMHGKNRWAWYGLKSGG